MRILIFGAGAVGTLLGGLLANEGHEVHFVGRKWIVDPIRNRGITISGVWGEYSIEPQAAFESVDAIPAGERDYDLIVITTKAFATEDTVRVIEPLLSEATTVLTCQNGYGNCQIIAKRIGWHRTLGARFITGVEIDDHARIQVTVHADAVRIGHYLNGYPMAQIESLALMMKEAHIPAEATDQLEQYIWAKILYNAALNPMGALLGVCYGDLAEHQDTRATMDRIMDEAFAVTNAHGIRQFWESAEAYRRAFYEEMIPPTAAHFPSMLRDFQRGRRTEIDSLNGAIQRLGRDKGISTPTNDAITALARFYEMKQTSMK